MRFFYDCKDVWEEVRVLWRGCEVFFRGVLVRDVNVLIFLDF